jgi:Ca2+:H+ antiporter
LGYADRVSRFGLRNPVDLLLVLVPVAILLELLHSAPVAIFAVAALAIVPLAGVMGRATEALSEKAGPGIGGLLNATFGNAAELIIAAIGLSHGLGAVVKASITGSIIGNCLLVLGASILAGGLKHPVQRFNRTAASLGTTLMALAAIGLLVPTLFWASAKQEGTPESDATPAAATEAASRPEGHAASGPGADSPDTTFVPERHAAPVATDRLEVLERGLSREIAFVLGCVYVLSLVFSLRTHRHLYAGEPSASHGREGAHGAAGKAHGEGKTGGILRPVLMLLGASVLVGVLAEILVGALEPTARAMGLTDLFVGVIVVAIVGNAAEHSSAIFAAMRNDMDLALNIAIGSSLQIALFVTPLLLAISYFVGNSPIDLHFTLFEVAGVVMAVGATTLVAQDGESHWMEGVMLLAVYVILGVAFYFLPG